jgi:hypothetical protein
VGDAMARMWGKHGRVKQRLAGSGAVELADGNLDGFPNGASEGKRKGAGRRHVVQSVASPPGPFLHEGKANGLSCNGNHRERTPP